MYLYNYTIRPREQLSTAKMTLRFLLRDSLPDPKSSLSFAIPAQAIAQANQEVQATAEKDIHVREKRKRSAYNHYSPTDDADIEKYASQHGVNVSILVKAADTRDPFHNPSFSLCMWTNFVVIYFCGCPRPQKYFNTKIYRTKFPNTKIFRITVYRRVQCSAMVSDSCGQLQC